jgi:hypothetical protein
MPQNFIFENYLAILYIEIQQLSIAGFDNTHNVTWNNQGMYNCVLRSIQQDNDACLCQV